MHRRPGTRNIKAFRKGVWEFQTYIANDAHAIPHYAERHRYGERVSTAFVESTVNTVVGKRLLEAAADAMVKIRSTPSCFEPEPACSTARSEPGFSPGIPGSSTRQTQIRQWNERPLDPGDFGGSLEEVLLGGVVERFRSSVQTRQMDFLEDITRDDCSTVEAAMTKCSRWLRGHDDAPAARAPVPDPLELKTDIDKLANFLAAIRRRRNS